MQHTQKKISKSESEIDWNETAQKLIEKINGLNPYPGVWFKQNGNRIKILEAEISENLGKNGLYLPMGAHINRKIQTKIVKSIENTLAEITK